MSESSDVASPKGILIVRLGAMGDIIHALPAAKMLREVHPGNTITWIIEERWASLLTAGFRFTEDRIPEQPVADDIFVVDTKLWRKQWHSATTVKEISEIFRELRAWPFDLAVDFQGALKSALIARLSGAREVWGFANPREKPASLLYTRKIVARSKHVVEQNFELAKAALRMTDRAEHQQSTSSELLPMDAAVATDVTRRLESFGIFHQFAIINPGAGWGAKQWPADRYADVARELGKQGIRSLINYGPGEEELANIVERNGAGYAVATRFTIPELMAVTRKASLFIGGDTGPMHVAASLQVPVVAIFGPTDPARNGPYGTKSIVLRDPSSVTSHKRIRTAEAGLLNITTVQVLKAARELLGHQLSNHKTEEVRR